ncbi:Cut8 six-helix bundle-domain-containing protein [Polychytrium aggregatum]|uniref:Cut8 six-helix bundle-domain-containing protein n=1 Tax=Polychytrium aggregatum TaxID=110093 RepID=UPI0022FDF364|nr:Cut8 six-helix bundle-domain-containing protein [Polychytrium aggregatum]KAI9202291.1 Cut8 six-helix bundle-domain-containing protein [Polychytrium aggregatum]
MYSLKRKAPPTADAAMDMQQDERSVLIPKRIRPSHYQQPDSSQPLFSQPPPSIEPHAVAVAAPEPAAPAVSVDPHLPKLLATLDKAELIGIITQVMSAHPALHASITSLVPRPTLSTVSALLIQAEKKLNDAFPYSKFGQDRSDYAFNRVRPHLFELKELVLHYLTFFTLPQSYPESMYHEFPQCSMAYLHFVTSLVHRLPRWTNETHNIETTTDLYVQLARAWRFAYIEIGRRFKEEGKIFGASVIGDWARSLNHHYTECKGAHGFDEALEEFKRQLGWLIGLNPRSGLPDPSLDSSPLRRMSTGRSVFGSLQGSHGLINQPCL